jgi:hypothetical protein
MSELTLEMWRHDMMISQGMVYGKQLDELIWKERERWAVRGFLAGVVTMCIIWMIVLSL